MTGTGIVILVICAIGVYSVSRWAFTQLVKLNQRYLVKQPEAAPKKKYIRIGLRGKLVCYDDLPKANKYKGRTWLGGLPVMANVVVPWKKDYSTIIYMDHWFKQYAYDVMGNFAGGLDIKGVAWHLVFPVTFIIVGINPTAVLAFTGLFYAWVFLWFAPSAHRASREMGEDDKNLTFADWQKIDLDVAKDLAEEERLVSAIRRAGIHRPW